MMNVTNTSEDTIKDIIINEMHKIDSIKLCNIHLDKPCSIKNFIFEFMDIYPNACGSIYVHSSEYNKTGMTFFKNKELLHPSNSNDHIKRLMLLTSKSMDNEFTDFNIVNIVPCQLYDIVVNVKYIGFVSEEDYKALIGGQSDDECD